MKKLYIIILLCLAIGGCSKKRMASKSKRPAVAMEKSNNITTTTQKNPAAHGFIKALVLNFKGRDGCDFALQLENKENLEPNLLPEAFQQDSLKVWIKYELRKNTASICMIGKMIKVLEIQKQ